MNASTIQLAQLATARSGDKGNHANLGIVAFAQDGYDFLVREMTSQRVADFFPGLGITRVERFELPKVWALNFVLYNALDGGASQSLRIDTQGKLLGTAVLKMQFSLPDNACRTMPDK